MRVKSRALIAAAICGLWPAAPALAQDSGVPDFSGLWARTENAAGRTFHPLPQRPSPVMPAADAGNLSIGDDASPILLPRAAEAVKAFGDSGRAGNVELPAWSLCWPSGVPLVLNMGEPVWFLQEPDQVTIVYQRDMQVRRIDLNREHRENVRPSWYGVSAGHYEGGDTLVVDTRLQNDRAVVDRYGTPRSEDIHVVERYTISPDRSALHVEFTVEDPQMFTVPWMGQIDYFPTEESFHERVCAENNKDPNGGIFPIPESDRADF